MCHMRWYEAGGVYTSILSPQSIENPLSKTTSIAKLTLDTVVDVIMNPGKK